MFFSMTFLNLCCNGVVPSTRRLLGCAAVAFREAIGLCGCCRQYWRRIVCLLRLPFYSGGELVFGLFPPLRAQPPTDVHALSWNLSSRVTWWIGYEDGACVPLLLVLPFNSLLICLGELVIPLLLIPLSHIWQYPLALFILHFQGVLL
jgi:hypothetical protein